MATRTRFAPSPTGDLHLGGAWTALASWVVARREAGGAARAARRGPRSAAGRRRAREARIEEDLRWLGLDWDEGADAAERARRAAYEDAIARLAASGLVYPCDCSRAEIARAASAPHAGEETVYPGTCRDARPGARDEARAGAARARAGRGRRLRRRRGRARGAEPRARRWATSSCGAATASSRTSSRWWSTTSATGSPTSCAARTSWRRRRGRFWLARALGRGAAALHARARWSSRRTGRGSRSGRAARRCGSCATRG